MGNTRLSLDMTFPQVIITMADGNPGAMSALIQTSKFTGDPDNALGFLSPIMTLDNNEIYGTKIYILFNDICKSDVTKFAAVLRAVQLGEFSGAVLQDASSREDRSGVDLVPVDDLYQKVKSVLPNFDNP